MASDGFTHSTIDNSVLRKRLANPDDQEAWQLAAERYGPLIDAFARKAGLSREDAADARQEALLAFALALREGRFDGQRGSLREFLFGIARHKVRDVQERRGKVLAAVVQSPDSGFFERTAGTDGWEELWTAEWQLAVRAQCLKEAQAHFSDETYLLFHLKVIEAHSSAEVARRTGKTAAAVDMATHHVRRFLREILPVIAEIF